ncbi:MAG TPA: histidine phosphatase family protein [Solirubrobacteraceae bacterium]
MRRLLLVRHAPTRATRAASFPADEPLDERGRADAALLGARLPARHELLCSPALRCVETARAAGLADPLLRPALGECDFGSWSGRSLAEVHEQDPEAAAAWIADPGACPHGGESLATLAARVAAWLDEQALLDGRAVAITHGGVVKAAVVHALGAPIAAFWQVDSAPLSITELHAHDGRWTLARVNSVLRDERDPRETRPGAAREAGGAGPRETGEANRATPGEAGGGDARLVTAGADAGGRS